MNEITTKINTHVIIFHDGSNMKISAKQFASINTLRNSNITGCDINTDTGLQFIQFSSIAKILTNEEFADQYPEKEIPNYQQPAPKIPVDINQIVDEFGWVLQAFNFTDLFLLATKTYGKISDLKNEEEFKAFCLKHKAITESGAITTASGKDKKGKTVRIPFAYPFYCRIWELVQAKRRKVEFAEEKSWNQLMHLQG